MGAVTTSTQLDSTTRLILVCFLAGFPLIVLYAFYVLVTQHHFKLYSPEDVEGKRGFIRLVHVQNETEVKQHIQQKIELIEESRPAIEHAVAGDDPSKKLLTLQHIARFSSGDIRTLRSEMHNISPRFKDLSHVEQNMVFELINFLEEVAVAVRERLVDETMIKEVMASRMVYFWDELMERWIKPVREMSGLNTYSGLESLVEAWRQCSVSGALGKGGY